MLKPLPRPQKSLASEAVAVRPWSSCSAVSAEAEVEYTRIACSSIDPHDMFTLHESKPIAAAEHAVAVVLASKA